MTCCNLNCLGMECLETFYIYLLKKSCFHSVSIESSSILTECVWDCTLMVFASSCRVCSYRASIPFRFSGLTICFWIPGLPASTTIWRKFSPEGDKGTFYLVHCLFWSSASLTNVLLCRCVLPELPAERWMPGLLFLLLLFFQSWTQTSHNVNECKHSL